MLYIYIYILSYTQLPVAIFSDKIINSLFGFWESNMAFYRTDKDFENHEQILQKVVLVTNWIAYISRITLCF